jgi:hypothetical protein
MAKKAKPERTAKLTDWVTQDRKRKMLSFIGAGLVVVAGAAWGVFKYYNDPGVKMVVSYKLCLSLEQKHCPDGYVWLKGPTDMANSANAQRNLISNWVKTECAKYAAREITQRDADAICECVTVEVRCSST